MAWVVPFIPYIAGAAATVYAAQQQKEASDEQAALLESNAKTTRLQSNAAEEAQRRQARIIMGEVRANAADTGFSPGGGSLLNLQTQTAGELELDALTTRYRGELSAIGLNADASMARNNGRRAQTSGYLNAFGTLMSGGSRYMASSKIAQYNYNNDAGGENFSASGEAIRGRR